MRRGDSDYSVAARIFCVNTVRRVSATDGDVEGVMDFICKQFFYLLTVVFDHTSVVCRDRLHVGCIESNLHTFLSYFDEFISVM